MPKFFYLLLLLFLFPAMITAQDNRIVPVSHWTMEYLQYLQQRGHLQELHPTRLPWVYYEVSEALSSLDKNQLSATEQYWLRSLKSYYLKDHSDFGIDFSAEIRKYNSDREELLRPRGSGEIATPVARLGFWYNWNNWAIRSGFTTDVAYWQDPDGVDVTHRLLGRTEDYYIGYNGDKFSAYFGRFDRHWGLHNRPAATISNNPRSYDAVTLRFGGNQISLSSLWGQLDNLAADGSFYSRDSFEPGAKKRFISLHRVDWAPRPNLKLTFFEGVIYAGEHAGIELEYMNPLPVWAISQDGDPKNVYANLVMGLMGWWNYRNWTVHAEFMLDDIVVNDRAGAKARNDFKPAAMGLMVNIQRSAISDHFDAGLGAQMISSTAYRSELFMGQWSYAQRGLGTNFSDFIQLDGFLRWHAHHYLPGLVVEPYFEHLLQGEGDLRLPQSVTMPNGQNIPLVLSGTVAQHTRFAIRANYRYSPNLWAGIDWGVNILLNRDHRTDFDETLLVGRFIIGGRINYRN